MLFRMANALIIAASLAMGAQKDSNGSVVNPYWFEEDAKEYLQKEYVDRNESGYVDPYWFESNDTTEKKH